MPERFPGYGSTVKRPEAKLGVELHPAEECFNVKPRVRAGTDGAWGKTAVAEPPISFLPLLPARMFEDAARLLSWDVATVEVLRLLDDVPGRAGIRVASVPAAPAVPSRWIPVRSIVPRPGEARDQLRTAGTLASDPARGTSQLIAGLIPTDGVHLAWHPGQWLDLTALVVAQGSVFEVLLDEALAADPADQWPELQGPLMMPKPD